MERSERVWGGRVPWSSCWAPAAARRWGGRRGRGRQTGGRLGSREWSRSSQRDNAHMDGMWMTGDKAQKNLSQCEYGWNVQGTRLRAHAQWNCLWMCSLWSATQSLMCCVVPLSTSSLVFVLFVRLLLCTLWSWFSLLWYCINSCHSFPVAIFHMFSLYSHGILGVVSTHTVGYSRPPSAVNDPTVTKQVNSRKSCLEEVSQLLFFNHVSLINQYWVRLHGDFRKNKESTMFLASSTKMKNSFVSIAGFVELLLLFLSSAAR